jgi:branched-chain amino acid transport system substrate-binding protein
MMKKRFMSMLTVGILMAAFLSVGYAAETINIGYTGPLSGGAAKFGQNCLKGEEHAIAEINAAGGITVNNKNYTFKLTSIDDRYKPAETVSNVRRMMSTLNPKPLAIFHPTSGGVMALAPLTEKEGFILYGYTDNVEVFKNAPKLIITQYSLAFHNSAPLDAGWDRGYRKVALLCGTHEAGKNAESVTIRQWTEKGGEIVSVDGINFTNITDFYPFLTKALAKNPDCLYLYGPAEPTAMLIKQSRELGFKGGYLLGSQCKLDEMVRVVPLETLNNSVGPCPVEMVPTPGMEGYARRHKDFFKGDPPSNESASTYEMMYIIAEAIKKAGSVSDYGKVRAAIAEVVPVGKHAITNVFRISPQGQLMKPYYVMPILNGKFGKPIMADPVLWARKFGCTWPATWPTAPWRD